LAFGEGIDHIALARHLTNPTVVLNRHGHLEALYD
jgi:hypothetical protein